MFLIKRSCSWTTATNCNPSKETSWKQSSVCSVSSSPVLQTKRTARGPHLLHRSRLRTGERACPGRGWCRRRCYGRHSGTPPVDSVAESDKSDKSEKFADLEHEDLNRLSHVMNASQAAFVRSLVTSIFLGGPFSASSPPSFAECGKVLWQAQT